MKYVIINEDKVPQHSLDKTYSLEEVKDYDNLAVLVEEPYVVYDIDNLDYGSVLYKILENYNIKSNIMKTDKGYHFWFKTNTPLQNGQNINTPITLKTDIKSWGKKSLVTVKHNGKDRKWITSYNDIDEVPFWLKPIKLKKDLFNFDDGDGRDDSLFTYIIPLLGLKFNKIQIKAIFNIINTFVFKTPLLQKEIDKMFDGNTIFDETLGFFNKKEFLHHEFAHWLKSEYPIEYFGGDLYIYKDGVYSVNKLLLEQLMIQRISSLKSQNRWETFKYLEIICASTVRLPPPLLVNCNTGLLNIKTDKIQAHSPRIFTINKIPVNYSPGHYDEIVDNFLNDIAKHDNEIRLLLEEVLGYCIINDCRLQKAFILLGEGANGKSVFLKMLRNFLGQDSVSSITLEELNNKFKTAELVGKMANLGDDISAEFLVNSSIFKKLVSSETITIERKHEHPFQFANIAKLIFSTNHLPPMSDKSFGLYRRLLIIPFLNKFVKHGEHNYDPVIINKLTTESAKTYLLNLAINAAKRLLDNNEFTESSKVTELINVFIAQNNNCIQWIKEEPEYLDIDIKAVYKDYCIYCASVNIPPYKKTRFINEILSILPDIKLQNTTKEGDFVQKFVKK